MRDIDKLIFNFTEHLKVLNRSPSTIKSYSTDARYFLQSLDIHDIRQVTATMIEAYIADLHNYVSSETGRPYKTTSIGIKIRSIKRLFEYLEKTNRIFINPAEFIKEPPRDRRLPKNVLTRKEAAKILDQPNLGTPKGIKDRTILEVLYSTGIRRAELCALTIYDADLTGKLLRVNQGKGKKDRVVPLGKHAVKFLREYIARVRPRLTKNNRKLRALFVSKDGRPLSSQVLNVTVRSYAQKAKLDKKVSPHTFRHSFATALVKNGADIVAVQKMLGHVDLKTTQQYIRTLGLDIKAVHQRTHPREKDKAENAKPELERIKDEYRFKTAHNV